MITDKIYGSSLSNEQMDYNNALSLYDSLRRKPAKDRNALDTEFMTDFSKINVALLGRDKGAEKVSIIYQTYTSKVRKIIQKELASLLLQQ